MTTHVQSGISYYGYIDGEMIQWWLFEQEHLAVRTLDDTRIFIAKENWTYQKKLLGFDQIEFRFSYLRAVHFLKIKVNSKRDLTADGQTFAMGKNGPLNIKVRSFSSMFNGEKIIDPDGLMYGKDNKPYIDQIWGILHTQGKKPFFVFWRSLKKDPGVGCLFAQQESEVFIIQQLIKNQKSGDHLIELENMSGEKLVVSPDHLSEIRDGIVAKSIMTVSHLQKQIGRIRSPNGLPTTALDANQMANTKLNIRGN